MKDMLKGKHLDTALLVLRLAAGVIFVIHGYGKLFGNAPGMPAFTGMVAALGFPFPLLFAYLAALSEFVGGILLILGFYAEIAAIFTAVVMLVSFIGIKHLKLPIGDPDLALLAMSIAIALVGGGRYTLKSLMGGKQESACMVCGKK